MDIGIDLHSSSVTEKEIVYFADKICNGTGIDLNYHKRFSKSLTQSPWTNQRRKYETVCYAIFLNLS